MTKILRLGALFQKPDLFQLAGEPQTEACPWYPTPSRIPIPKTSCVRRGRPLRTTYWIDNLGKLCKTLYWKIESNGTNVIVLLRGILVCTLIGHVATGFLIGAGVGVAVMCLVGVFEPLSVQEAIGTTLTCVAIGTGLGFFSGWSLLRNEWTPRTYMFGP